MRRHPAGLVEHAEVVVLVDDREGEARLGHDRRGQGRQRHAVAGAQAKAFGGDAIVHAHGALGEQPPDDPP